LRPLIAWTLLAGVVAAVVASILMSAQTQLYRRVPLEKPPEALSGFFLAAMSGASVSNLLTGGLLVGGLAAFLLTRFGFLPIVANFVVWRILEDFPFTTQGSAWYSGMSLAGTLLLASIALCAF